MPHLSLRRPKACGNPSTTDIYLFTKKQKNSLPFTTFVIATKKAILHRRSSSLRGVKRRSNSQTTILLFIQRKIKEFTTLYPFVIARLRRSRGNPQTTNSKYKNRKKEFTTFNQVKELILNEILIFNFQFSISYASFVSHFVGRQAKMLMQAYHFPTLCFNFQFLSQPPCCFATSPLTKGGKPPQTTKSKCKNRK